MSGTQICSKTAEIFYKKSIEQMLADIVNNPELFKRVIASVKTNMGVWL